MKISYNWLKDYLDFDESPVQLGEILTEIGLEVEGLERFESIPGGLEGVITGEVLSVEPHPNADRLQLTTVDIGGPAVQNIVCGAPNVAAGQKVLVAPPGTRLYPIEGEPFEIRKTKIRGAVSEGMICAEDEIGLGTSHEGILVLDPGTKVGCPAADLYDIHIDHVFEIGLTPNRSDATCHLGVAKDLAAALTFLKQKPYKVRIPDISAFHADEIRHDIGVQVEDTLRCPRYSSLTVSDLKLGPSPKWMTERLTAIGVRPINNVVDITNYILHETGQPLHAFDLKALKGNQVYVQCLAEGSKFTTLDGIERTLTGEDLMICNSDREPMCLAGVFGGAESGVSAETRDIFLESAHFDATSVRKSSVWHNLRTDAARVFEKGSDPAVTTFALKRAALLFKEFAGGTITSQVGDEYEKEIPRARVKLRLAQVMKIVGVEIPEEAILMILEALDLEIVNRTVETLELAVPTNKADVTREADVIEEILRIYGFNNIPVDQKLEISLHSGERNLQFEFRDKVSTLMAGMGFDETMALSFALPQHLRVEDDPTYVRIHNTSNKELEIMRPDLITSALATVEYNQKRQNQSLSFYEFGRSYSYDNESFGEQNHMGITLTGNENSGNWVQPLPPSGFFHLKSVVMRILESLNIAGYQENELDHPAFLYGLRLSRGPQQLAVFGRLDLRPFTRTDIRGEIYFADINWDLVLQLASPVRKLASISKYPTIERDLALIVSSEVHFGDIRTEIGRAGGRLIRDISLFDVYEDEEQLGRGKQSYGVKILFSDPEKTLSDQEVDQKVSKILNNLQRKWEISLR